VDLAYLRAHPQQLPAFLTHQRIRETPVSGGSICVAQRLTLEDGSSVFAKSLPAAPDGFFAAEAAGLTWLRAADAVPVPEVYAVFADMLAMEWVEPAAPSIVAAERFGRELALLHRSGAPSFGFAGARAGFIGRLPLDNAVTREPWASWFAARRLEPFLKMSVDSGALSSADSALVNRAAERLSSLGGDEPPARIHGDLWPGNVVWAADRAWLVDPAAHGGHRETDLALLGLFGGIAFYDRVLASYDETWPLSAGWRERAPAHQLYLLLVHTALFGAGYRGAVLGAAEALL
jgi:fructosamine-3-kinase